MHTKLDTKVNDIFEFNEIIEDMKYNEKVLEMKKFRQHFDTSCYDHCLTASYYSYKICKKFKLDYKSAARAAMVHDLFLYDWRKPNPYGGLHAFTHGKLAYENASKIFEINKKEKDIILKHMWPLCIGIPRYPESFVVSFVDKYCVFHETTYKLLNNFSLKNGFKHVYLLIMILLFKKK